MNDEKYMLRALNLAQLGIGSVSPNPAVGAVIVHNGEIIGEGWHKIYGGPHAEVNAINSVIDNYLLAFSTMYVTLEPCSHWGKTPPCCDLIIANKIPRVVVGVVDPYCEVCGNGIKKLKDAGIDVAVGVLEKECTEINLPFFTSNHKGRPYIILKWAQSSDHFIDIARDQTTDVKWFTGAKYKTLVHKWRSEVDCIMVGRRTVEMDNPELNVRQYFGKNPIRATIDGDLKLNCSYKIFNNAAKTILFTKEANVENGKIKFSNNKNVYVVGLDYSGNIPTQICNYLDSIKIQSLFIEGGSFLINSFYNEKLCDQARIFTSSKTINDIYFNVKKVVGIPAPQINQISTTVNNDTNCRLGVINL